MDTYRLIHLPTGRAAAAVHRADHWRAKGWGLLGRSALPESEGLWLPGVASVHTLFLGFPLDLLFLDGDFRTVRLAPQTPAWRWLVRAAGACHTVELGAGTLARRVPEAKLGDEWTLERANDGPC